MSIFSIIKELADRDDAGEAAARGVTIEQLRADRRQAYRKSEGEAAEAERIRQEQAHQKRVEYGARLGLGVSAVPSISVRLSGLYESRGDGANRKTVTHVRVLQPFHWGRIRRRAHAFLCRDNVGREGCSDQEMDARITCPKCRSIIARIKDGL